jgi:hypothetical protein
MFCDNKYTKIYYTIIERAKSRTLFDSKYEKHHIIPKSIGGADDKSNIVKLTYKEHRLCHILLTKMVSDPKHKISMNCAAYRMVCCNKYTGISKGSLYQIIKEKYNHYNKTKVVSEETKRKIKEKRALQTNISNQYLSGNQKESPRKGKNKTTDEGYAKLSQKLRGRKITWKDKLSDKAKQRPKCSCIKCRRVIQSGYNADKHFLVCF